jgi:hypothetical protein
MAKHHQHEKTASDRHEQHPYQGVPAALFGGWLGGMSGGLAGQEIGGNMAKEHAKEPALQKTKDMVQREKEQRLGKVMEDIETMTPLYEKQIAESQKHFDLHSSSHKHLLDQLKPMSLAPEAEQKEYSGRLADAMFSEVMAKSKVDHAKDELAELHGKPLKIQNQFSNRMQNLTDELYYHSLLGDAELVGHQIGGAIGGIGGALAVGTGAYGLSRYLHNRQDHHEKVASIMNQIKNFAHDFSGKNEEKAHRALVETMKLEKEKKVPSSELTTAIKNNSIATENKYVARRRGVAVGTLAGGAATAGGVAYGINKKES